MMCNRHSAKHWIYPAGVPERAYQLAMMKTALLHNTLVALPTGLGKTLIAAVVMCVFCRAADLRQGPLQQVATANGILPHTLKGAPL